MPSWGDSIWNWIVDPVTPGATTYGGASTAPGSVTPGGVTIPEGTPDTWELPGVPGGQGSDIDWWDMFATNWGEGIKENANAVGAVIGDATSTLTDAAGSGLMAFITRNKLIVLVLVLVLVAWLAWPLLVAGRAASPAIVAAVTSPPSKARNDRGRFKKRGE